MVPNSMATLLQRLVARQASRNGEVAQPSVASASPGAPATVGAMNTFSAQTESDAVVPAPRSDIWAALTDPDLLPKLTPFLERIEADGDLWRWELSRIPILGVALAPCFTERMTFD